MERGVKLQQETALLIGAGFTARALIAHLKARGMGVIATCRSHDSAQALRDLGASPLIYNSGHAALLKKALGEATHIISSVPPNKSTANKNAPLTDPVLGDPVLKDIGGKLLDFAPNLKWAAYLSATSVYGDRKGQWAFEDEFLRPMTRRGHARIEAELAWLETGAPVHIFRLAGIYGPSRNPFDKILGGTARAVIKPRHIVNRIHVDDICRALLASMDRPNPAQVYNTADGQPAPPQDVLDYAADMLAAPRPPRIAHEHADISDMARSFYLETKAVDISRAKTELKWQPQYASYREGLSAIFEAEGRSARGVTLTGFINVPDDDAESVAKALPEHIRLTQAETGCESFRVSQDPQDPLRYHLYERFSSVAAFKAHQQRAAQSSWAKASKNVTRHYQIFGA